ncbi:hypothetical protein ARMGADRAFT_933202, partial [Armillaria gallica]
VRNVYLRCGHTVNLPEEIIRCEQSTCRFSLFHPADCKPPACLKTCWQYRRYPEQYCMDSKASGVLAFPADMFSSSPHQFVLPQLLSAIPRWQLKHPVYQLTLPRLADGFKCGPLRLRLKNRT